MTVTKITRPVAREVLAAINTALVAVGEEYGLSIKTNGGGSFRDTSIIVKVEAAVLNPDTGAVESDEAIAFKAVARGINLTPEHLGTEFSLDNGVRVRLAGYKSRRKKYPITCAPVDGGSNYKIPVHTLQRLLGVAIQESIPSFRGRAF